MDVSDNEFGGIEVSKGSSVTSDAILTVAGTVVNTTEEDAAPTAWTECQAGGASPEGSINGVSWKQALIEKTGATTTYQIYWYING